MKINASTIIAITLIVLLSASSKVQAQLLPSMYQIPGYDAVRDYGGGFDTVDPYTGALKILHTDMVIPLNGQLDIVIQRSYESTSMGSNPGFSRYGSGKSFMGIGWDLHFGRIWTPYGEIPASNGTACLIPTLQTPEGRLTLELPDGTAQVLYSSIDANSAYMSSQRWIAKCLPTSADTGDGGLLVYAPDGTKYTFNRLGYVKYLTSTAYVPTKIEDRNGNVLTLSYRVDDDTSDVIDLLLLDEVDSPQTSPVKFAWEDLTFGSNSQVGRNARLKSITYEARKIEFEYSEITVPAFQVMGLKFYHLDHVKLPDAQTWDYSYEDYAGDPNYNKLQLETVTTPLNANITYRYDWVLNPASVQEINVVDRREVENGSDTYIWTYAYNFTSSLAGTDLTTVVTPEQCFKYVHKGLVAANDQWRIGTLLNKKTYNKSGTACGATLAQEEAYVWEKEKISNDAQYVSLPESTSVDGTHIPRLASSVITRDSTTYSKTLTNYDAFGNARSVVTAQSGAQTKTATYTYDVKTSNWIIHLLDTEFYQTGSSPNIDRQYDSSGNLDVETIFGKTTNYDYLSTGEVDDVTDPDGHMTDYSDYYRGIARSESQPDGISITRSVDTYGNIASETFGGLSGGYVPAGHSDSSNTVGYTHDSMNRITGITTPRTDDSNYTINYSFGSTGLTRQITRGSLGITEKYDNLGRKVEVASEGITDRYSYDGVDRLTKEYYPNSTSQAKTYTYDPLDRIKSQTDNTDSSSINYNYLSTNRVTVTDEDSRATTYTYRSFDDPDDKDLIKIEAPEGQTTVIQRDILGLIDYVTQGGITHDYAYNTKRLLVGESRPETGDIEYGRDNRGNMTGRRIASSPEGSSPWTYFTYDGHSRLKTVNYPGSTPDVALWYTKHGSPWQVTRGSSKWDYEYDKNENLKEEKLSLTGSFGQTFTLARNYNSLDHEVSMTFPSGKLVSTPRNDLGRITSLSQTGGLGTMVSGVQHHASGNLSQYTYGNNRSMTVSESPRRRPARYTVSGGGVADFLYEYTKAGDVQKITDYVDTGRTRNFGYDNLHRLESVTGNAGSWGTASFTYSSSGDIKTQRIGSVTHTINYDSDKRVTSLVGGGNNVLYDYDVYGNVTQKGSQSFVYDDSSNLIKDSTSPTPNYAYDGHNHRFWQKTGNGDDVFSVYTLAGQLVHRKNIQEGGTSDYIYMDSLMVARVDYCDTAVDTDNDTLANCTEAQIGTDPEVDDSEIDNDDDGLSNLQEYHLGTGINDPDSDNDELPDGYEVSNDLDPLNGNDADDDEDDDGLSNLDEFERGTLVGNPDTDSDQIPDGYEVTHNQNPLNGTDANSDSDGDTLTNLDEFTAGTDPAQNDTGLDNDSDGLNNVVEYQMGTNLNDADTDNDGVPDGYEVDNGMDPLVNADGSADFDGDQLSNRQEFQRGTDPNDSDTDNDQMPDGFEVANQLNPNANDADDDPDGDGVSNLEEYLNGTDPQDGTNGNTILIPLFHQWLNR